VKGSEEQTSSDLDTLSKKLAKNRVCFPYSDQKSDKRTHGMYLRRLHEEHHVGNTLSELIKLPGLDLVQSFSLDYMHLVCLGVVRKLILLWLHKEPLYVRLYVRYVVILNNYLKLPKTSTSLSSINSYIPCDFVRKAREIYEVGRWKATELQLFLIYIGPIVLHVAMLILLSPNRQDYVAYAKQLLNYFVKTFEIIYGREHISHNVHGLLHISDDYEYYGPLDNSSAFVFENVMKELKAKIRKNENRWNN